MELETRGGAQFDDLALWRDIYYTTDSATQITFEVPEGHWFLLADNRDGAVDSRWWGPVPESRIQGVVRLRQGPEDPWRSAWQVLLPEE